MRAIYDSNPPLRGDKPANYDARKLRSTRAMIPNSLLGVINLEAGIHARYDSRGL